MVSGSKADKYNQPVSNISTQDALKDALQTCCDNLPKAQANKELSVKTEEEAPMQAL